MEYVYSKDNCILGYDENVDCLFIGKINGEQEFLDVPVEFFSNKEIRQAIFNAYINLKDTDPITIYRAIREAASYETIHWASNLVGKDFWL